jgi:hypothetical protein
METCALLVSLRVTSQHLRYWTSHAASGEPEVSKNLRLAESGLRNYEIDINKMLCPPTEQDCPRNNQRTAHTLKTSRSKSFSAMEVKLLLISTDEGTWIEYYVSFHTEFVLLLSFHVNHLTQTSAVNQIQNCMILLSFYFYAHVNFRHETLWSFLSLCIVKWELIGVPVQALTLKRWRCNRFILLLPRGM